VLEAAEGMLEDMGDVLEDVGDLLEDVEDVPQKQCSRPREVLPYPLQRQHPAPPLNLVGDPLF